jgi:hypothetical protein
MDGLEKHFNSLIETLLLFVPLEVPTILPDWNVVSRSVVRIYNPMCHFQGVVVSPHLVVTSFHGNNDTDSEFTIEMSSGERKIAKLYYQVFKENVVDIALFTINENQPEFNEWVTIYQRLPAFKESLTAIGYVPSLGGEYAFSAQQTSIFLYQSGNQIAFAQYYCLDGLSGSGIVAETMNDGTVQLVGVHCGSHDNTTAPPPIKKYKNGAADSDSVSTNSNHLAKQLHGHSAFCFVTIAISVPEIIYCINADLPPN